MFFLANKPIILALAYICYEAVNAADDFLPERLHQKSLFAWLSEGYGMGAEGS